MISASQNILESLSDEHRRVVSLWRALIYLRRASRHLAPDERRWKRVPATEGDISPFLIQMQRRGDLQRVAGTRGVYEVTAPFAQAYGVDEREILFEINPYTILSHFSALVFHGLTMEQPKLMTAQSAHDWDAAPIPLGTDPREWDGFQLPAGPRPAKVRSLPVTWKRPAVRSLFDVLTQVMPSGVPFRITGVERTLVDVLQDPMQGGGIMNVLKAWVEARDDLDIGVVIEYTSLTGIALLRQRVGYVLEELGLSHPVLDRWAAESNRGGSSRLVGTEPLVPDYNRRWNLSLNAPVRILREDR